MNLCSLHDVDTKNEMIKNGIFDEILSVISMWISKVESPSRSSSHSFNITTQCDVELNLLKSVIYLLSSNDVGVYFFLSSDFYIEILNKLIYCCLSLFSTKIVPFVSLINILKYVCNIYDLLTVYSSHHSILLLDFPVLKPILSGLFFFFFLYKSVK
jgi:hypothetical protein